jgi:hypothetical protein
MVRLADLRHVGPDGQSLPLIADEPLAGVDRSDKLWMLELIGRAAGSPQVIYLTADPDVAAWARAEAQTGRLALVEPTPVPETTNGNGRSGVPGRGNNSGPASTPASGQVSPNIPVAH